MAVRFRLPSDSLFNDNGAPLAGGTIWFYESGTSTPLATYSDDDLVTANSNPVMLDAAGRQGDVFLQPKEYKVVVKDASGIVIKTMDPVHGTTSTIGGDMWSRPVASATNTPPVSPADGERHLIWSAPTGAWASYANQVAEYSSDGWHYSGAPAVGQTVYLSDGNGWLMWNGVSYTTLGAYVDTTSTQIIGGAKTFSSRAVFSDAFDIKTGGYGVKAWNTNSYDLRLRPIGAARRSEIVLMPNDVDGTEDVAGGEFTAMSRDETKYGSGNTLACTFFYDRTNDVSRIMAHAFGTATQTGFAIDPMGGVNITEWAPADGTLKHHGKLVIDVINAPQLLLQGSAAAYPSLDLADTTAPAATFRLRTYAGSFDLVHVDTGTKPFSIDNNNHPLFEGVQATASAANAYLDATTGELMRSTSTEAIKTGIVALGSAHFDIIDRLVPVTFRSLALADDPHREFIGFTAQGAAKVDARLAEFANGEPVKPNTDAILALLLLEVQRLKSEIKTLKGA